MEQRPRAVLSPGDVFHGNYEVRRCLKVGGMAIVYEVVHRVTRRPSALKVLLPEVLAERGMKNRFAIEARIPAEIEGDHIVEVLDAGIDEATGAAFLVMELLRGDDLETVLRQRGPFAAEDVVALLRQAALALDAVHAARIVHRDLKPSNLFLCEATASVATLKVLDFGVAKIVDGSALTTRNLGTPVYMSPEQVRGDADVDAAADVYALGHVAFTLLVGEAYWREESAAGGRRLFDRIEAGGVEPASVRAARRGVRLPAAFDPWFAKATAPDPEDRFETAGGLVEALAEALGGASAAAHTVRQRLDPRARRWSARLVVAGLVAIGVSGGTWGVSRAIARARDDAARGAVPSASAAATSADVMALPVVPNASSPSPPERSAPAYPSAAAPANARSASSAPSAPPSAAGRVVPAAHASAQAAIAPPAREAPATAPSTSPFGPGAF